MRKYSGRPLVKNRRPDYINLAQVMTVGLRQVYAWHQAPSPSDLLTHPAQGTRNDGRDNDNDDYILIRGRLLLNQRQPPSAYLILSLLGAGSFGQVVLCQHTLSGQYVAVKVIKNQPAYFQQAKVEIRLLLQCQQSNHVVQLQEFFLFENHLFLVFEVLGCSLYDQTRLNGYQGLSLLKVSEVTKQVLLGLEALHARDIIHCDLKPENILYTDQQQVSLKIIDLGSSCLSQELFYSYIQSRFYRAPEISLGLPYDHQIDLWSLGCVAVELFLGLPIFPASSQYDLVKRQFQILAPQYIQPNKERPQEEGIDRMIEQGSQGGLFFRKQEDLFGGSQVQLRSVDEYQQMTGRQEESSLQYFHIGCLDDLVNFVGKSQFRDERDNMYFEVFLDFVSRLLVIEPQQRSSVQSALNHPFLRLESASTQQMLRPSLQQPQDWPNEEQRVWGASEAPED